MELLGSTKNKIAKDEDGKNVSYFEINKVVLIHCNNVNNNYQQNSRVMYTFIPNKSLSQLLDTSPENIIILKFLKFSNIEVWFTNKNSKLLETEDKTNITLLIN